MATFCHDLMNNQASQPVYQDHPKKTENVVFNKWSLDRFSNSYVLCTPIGPYDTVLNIADQHKSSYTISYDKWYYIP